MMITILSFVLNDVDRWERPWDVGWCGDWTSITNSVIISGGQGHGSDSPSVPADPLAVVRWLRLRRGH